MIRHSLRLKLILAFLAVSLTGTILVAFFAGRMVTVQIDQAQLARVQANFITDAIEYYQDHGSWDEIDKNFEATFHPPPPNYNDDRPNLPPPPPLPFVLVDPTGHVIKSAGLQGYDVGDGVSEAEIMAGIPVQFEGQQIGTVLKIDNAEARDIFVWQALSRVYIVLGFTALAATLVAVVLGIFLARTLTRPVQELTVATQAMAQGNLEQQVKVRTKDELGQLAASFNQMSADLAQANHLRRQMTADIAHDLRSPLAVIAGYVEALRDGVLEPTPTMFETMYEETEHLQRLVEDLRTLSLADAGELPLHLEAVSVATLLEKQANAYHYQAQKQHVDMQVEADSTLPEIQVDPERIAQVLGNLISNALRYTPAQGRILLGAGLKENNVLLSIQDSGQGIAPKMLPHIFKRFYRVDESRQQESGESGLGLAIAKAIIEAHNGTISAQSTPGQGTTFTIALPIT